MENPPEDESLDEVLRVSTAKVNKHSHAIAPTDASANNFEGLCRLHARRGGGGEAEASLIK